jgi:3-isopropylmalate/(R)-2-methylmalate dehydratase small subunit
MLSGKAWSYGDNINTDVLFPGKYTYTLSERTDIARVALEDLDPAFAAHVKPGDVIVAGRNFGCGSSREQAATCLVYNQVGAVIAASFSRIFYRNALNNGLLVIVCPEAAAAIEQGDTVEIDTAAHLIHCRAGAFPFPPLSPSVMGIVAAGGLVEYVKRRLAGAGSLGTGALLAGDGAE